MGSPWNTARNPRSPASVSSSEPGSVIAANDSPRPRVSSQKKSRWERVSRVVPDFEETRKSVRSGSSDSARRRTAAGCVVSRTWNPSAPVARLSTSGARLEPPMPSRTVASKVSRASPANARISGRRSCIRAGSSSHPSHSSSPEPVQSVASRAQIRSTSSAASTY